MTPLAALEKSISIFGTQTALAEAIGTSQALVSWWVRSGRTSAANVIKIEEATDGVVTRHDLRPDIYP